MKAIDATISARRRPTWSAIVPITGAANALRLASNRYRAGYAAYIEQLDAQRGLLAADLTRIQSRADRLNALVDLYRAAGGGWTPAP